MNVHSMTPEQIRQKGLEALAKALSPVGMARFLQQFESGYGNYSIDRENWLGDMDVKQIAEEIEDLREKSDSKETR